MIKAELIGDYTIKINDIEVYSKNSPVSEMCRQLIQQGYEDQPMECYRSSTKCLTVKSIKKQSGLKIVSSSGTIDYYAPYDGKYIDEAK